MKDQQTAPKLAFRILKWFCKSQYHADIEGDLKESFQENLEHMSVRKAKWLLYRDLFQLFRPGIIKPVTPTSRASVSGLWKSNLKTTLRNLIKKKEYSLVNILGLSLGLASTLLVLLFVQYELSYDKFITDADQIYKLVEERKTPEATRLRGTVPYSFARTMPEDFPEIELATAFSGPYSGQQVVVKNAHGKLLNFLEDNVLLADQEFLTLFDIALISGNKHTALKEPNSVVLTESSALRFFGNTNPVGQLITAAGKNSVVTGVCKDLPQNSHIKFNYLVSSSSVAWFNRDDFTLKSTHCYVKIKRNTSAEALEVKFPEMVKTHMAGEIERIHQLSWEDYKESGNDHTYFLKPLTSIHLGAANLGGMKEGGSINRVNTLLAIALLIFGIACVNFINLATARSAERAREIGVRKVMGSQRSQLVYQFLTESVILSLISMLVSLGLVYMALPHFNQLAGTDIVLGFEVSYIALIIGLTFFVGILAGIYPALALSSFKAIKVLKGNFTAQNQGKWIRNGLVIFQFWIAIILIVCTLTIQQQVNYLSEKDLGFDKEQLLVIEGTFDRRGNFALPLLQEVKNMTQVRGAAGTMWLQGFQGTRSEQYISEGLHQPVNIARATIGDEFAEVLGLELLSGELFSSTSVDSAKMILNETAAKQLGLEDPINKKVALVSNDGGVTTKTWFTVKAVVKDFNFRSLRQEIAPLIMLSNEIYSSRMSSIIVRLEAGNINEGVNRIAKKWEELIPDKPFSFKFLDEIIDANYAREQRSSIIFSIFSGLSIFISVIGLFALSAYTVSMRAKEIGIRKVVGASVFTILKLLSKDFSKMVALAFILSLPVAWHFMSSWLNDFAYRVPLNPVLFILSGGSILVITWLTVGYQSLKAARTNPIIHLKNE